MKEQLSYNIKKIHSVNNDDLDIFLDLWQEYKAKRKEIISEEGKTDRFLYFVGNGAQKAFFNHDGKEHIVAFSYPFAFTCVPESFLTQKPSRYYWECISESTFLRISNDDFFKFIEKHPDFETLLWKKLLGTINGLVNRYHRLLALKMEDRFKDLMQNSPQLLNYIPQKEIANYLNMDPTNFSKLINKLKI